MGKLIGSVEHPVTQIGETGKFHSAGIVAVRIYRVAHFVEFAPGANHIEVFQRKTNRVDHHMAGRTDRVGPVLREPLTDGSRRSAITCLGQDRHIRRWRWWRRAKHVIQQPFAS